MKTYSKALYEICKACDNNLAYWYSVLDTNPTDRPTVENNLINAMLIANGMQDILQMTAK